MKNLGTDDSAVLRRILLTMITDIGLVVLGRCLAFQNLSKQVFIELLNSRHLNMMSLLKKIKDFFGFQFPNIDITPEREEEIIEKTAKLVSNFGMELPAILMGSAYVPMASVLTQFTLLPISPLLESIGIPGFEYTAFFEKKENVKRLLDRIDQLRKEREGA